MGFSHSWVAVQGLEPERAAETLGMEIEEARAPEDMTAGGFYLGIAPNGWLIALTDRRANAFEGALTELAKFGPAVACEVNESVMYSEARGYDDGSESWRVVYDCEEGPDALRVTGNPPAQLNEIRRKAEAEQEAEGGEDANVDVLFDIPALLARSICGFMLGENEPEGFRYLKLRRIGGEPEQRPGFFARLFGRA
jgi:hypothetical protein